MLIMAKMAKNLLDSLLATHRNFHCALILITKVCEHEASSIIITPNLTICVILFTALRWPVAYIGPS